MSCSFSCLKGDGDLEQIGEFSGVPVITNFLWEFSGLLTTLLGVRLQIDAISDTESILVENKLRVDPPCITNSKGYEL